MATVKATLTLIASDLTTDALSVSVLTTLSSMTVGGISREHIYGTAQASQDELAEQNGFSGVANLYIHNTETIAGRNIYVELGGAVAIVLSPGDWAWVPWSGTNDDINAYGTVTLSTIEFGVFSA
tara:strand:- start:838 stop:1212 length:375 start_codon:yes stop_codon:yes gene_type:complete